MITVRARLGTLVGTDPKIPVPEIGYLYNGVQVGQGVVGVNVHLGLDVLQECNTREDGISALLTEEARQHFRRQGKLNRELPKAIRTPMNKCSNGEGELVLTFSTSGGLFRIQKLRKFKDVLRFNAGSRETLFGKSLGRMTVGFTHYRVRGVRFARVLGA